MKPLLTAALLFLTLTFASCDWGGWDPYYDSSPRGGYASSIGEFDYCANLCSPSSSKYYMNCMFDCCYYRSCAARQGYYGATRDASAAQKYSFCNSVCYSFGGGYGDCMYKCCLYYDCSYEGYYGGGYSGEGGGGYDAGYEEESEYEGDYGNDDYAYCDDGCREQDQTDYDECMRICCDYYDCRY